MILPENPGVILLENHMRMAEHVSHLRHRNDNYDDDEDGDNDDDDDDDEDNIHD